ncbi:hypothetical protein [Micromonospora inaquosa]|nr:hypothetical protein [Micromonospora inaquosa]
MPLAPEILDNEYVAHVPLDICCPRCRRCTVRYDVVQYVDIDACPAFHDAVRRTYREVGAGLVIVSAGRPVEELVHCAECAFGFAPLAPLILDSPSRGLSVFVTHAGDDGGVEAGFRAVLHACTGLVPSAALAGARSRPYTFVHGWNGLEAMLAVFDGVQHHPPAPPYPHATEEEGYHAYSLHGYIYGKAFFYYPRFVAVQGLVSTLIAFSAAASSNRARRAFVELMQRLIETTRVTHPWLAQEVGRQLIGLEQFAEAQVWLHTAELLQHEWLAVTLDFHDSTPGRDEDAGASPSAARHGTGPVTRHRHAAVGNRPARMDYGLWHFPEMARHAPTLRLDHHLAGAGIMLGELDRMAWDEGLRTSNLAFADLGFASSDIKDLLTALGDTESEAVQAFWYEYTRARWRHQPGWDAALAAIDERTNALREQPGFGPLSIFRFGYDPEAALFYLNGAAKMMRSEIADRQHPPIIAQRRPPLPDAPTLDV